MGSPLLQSRGMCKGSGPHPSRESTETRAGGAGTHSDGAEPSAQHGGHGLGPGESSLLVRDDLEQEEQEMPVFCRILGLLQGCGENGTREEKINS